MSPHPPATEVRDLLAVLASSVVRDIEMAHPFVFAPLPDQPTERDRTIRMGAQALAELVHGASCLSVGLRDLKPGRPTPGTATLEAGLNQLNERHLMCHLFAGRPCHPRHDHAEAVFACGAEST